MNKFFEFLTVLCATIAGACLALPVAHSAPVLGAGAALGALLGYKQRKQKIFLWVSLIAILTMSTLLIREM